jgi:MOSC domain-containing protein YiiM
VKPGHLQAGDDIELVQRPDHGITIGTVYRAMMLEPELMPSLLVADALPEPLKRQARRRVS